VCVCVCLCVCVCVCVHQYGFLKYGFVMEVIILTLQPMPVTDPDILHQFGFGGAMVGWMFLRLCTYRFRVMWPPCPCNRATKSDFDDCRKQRENEYIYVWGNQAFSPGCACCERCRFVVTSLS
jgi:hypothetical protein